MPASTHALRRATGLETRRGTQVATGHRRLCTPARAANRAVRHPLALSQSHALLRESRRSARPTARGTHRVLPLTFCPIAHEQINNALSILSQQPNARPQLLIRCSTQSNQILIQPYPDEETRQKLAAAGLDAQAETMEERLGGAVFRIRPSSFFQTNTPQAEKMARMVLNGLLAHIPAGEQRALTIVDAYCGVGTFALLLARHVGK